MTMTMSDKMEIELNLNYPRMDRAMRALVASCLCNGNGWCTMETQSLAKRRTPGLVNFVPAVAYHICLALPAAFTQPRARFSAELCRSLHPSLALLKGTPHPLVGRSLARTFWGDQACDFQLPF